MSVVRIITPSRLHFGLFSFGHSSGRQFGGVGAMIDRPGLRLSIEQRPGRGEATAAGPLAERARRIAADCLAAMGIDSSEAYHVVVESAPPDHVGLGTGTQLALAVAAGLCRLNQQTAEVADLARITRRGERSAIGTHGFFQGGLLLEAGKLPGELLSPLLSRVEFPTDWRFVLVRPDAEKGLSGESERSAFDALPPVPEEVTRELCGEAELRLLPAAREANFGQFAASLGRYGRLAGECFSRCQGGPFAGEHGRRLVALIRGLGFSGVGQSSWGPTLFVVAPDEAAAHRLADQLHQRAGIPLETLVTPVARRGASVEVAS